LLVLCEEADKDLVLTHVLGGLAVVSLELVVGVVHEKDLEDLIVLGDCSNMKRSTSFNVSYDIDVCCLKTKQNLNDYVRT